MVSDCKLLALCCEEAWVGKCVFLNRLQMVIEHMVDIFSNPSITPGWKMKVASDKASSCTIRIIQGRIG